MSFFCVAGLTKRLGNEKVFQDIHFEIEAGEFVTLLGSSDRGPSALLRTLAGLIQADAGSIHIAGREIGSLHPRERNIALLAQSCPLFPNMTVAENIGFDLKMRKIPPREIEFRVCRMIQWVHLENQAKKYPRHLSRGQQQRTALARALVSEPQLLLLDEPPSALDPQIRKSLLDQIRELQKNLHIATLFVTHDQEEALTVSDRIFLMDQGRITQTGAPEEIYTQLGSELAARFIGNYNVFQKEDFDILPPSIPEGGLFAVRPAAIEVIPARQGLTWEDTPPSYHTECNRPGAIHMAGLLIDTIVRGNTLRHFVRVNQRILMADLVKDGNARPVKPGQSVSLWIPFSECLPLKATYRPLKRPA